jgi:hypothetical protein
MTTVLWESDDQFNSIYSIWSGGLTQYSANVYADLTYAYVCATTIYRIVVGSGVERNVTLIQPEVLDFNHHYLLSNYLTEWGLGAAQVILHVPSGRLWWSSYPATPSTWQQANDLGYEGVDIIFPDMPQSPRFVIGVSGIPHALVTLAASGLVDRYNTNWSAMTASGTVTDLESMRII